MVSDLLRDYTEGIILTERRDDDYLLFDCNALTIATPDPVLIKRTKA